MIEDIKGYKPHTDEKIELVNIVKSVENNLGQVYTSILTRLDTELTLADADSLEASDIRERISQVEHAIRSLKESSMWACRSIFRPVEFY